MKMTNASPKSGAAPLQARDHLLRVCGRASARLCTKHELLRVWNPLWSSHHRCTWRQKISSRNDLPLNTRRHLKHGRLRALVNDAIHSRYRVMKDLQYRGITLQAEPSSLRCVVEMKDQRKPLPPACLCATAACPAAKKKKNTESERKKKEHRAYIARDKVRIKNKRILEHITSFTQETTSWICGRPHVFQLDGEGAQTEEAWRDGRQRSQSTRFRPDSHKPAGAERQSGCWKLSKTARQPVLIDKELSSDIFEECSL